MQTMQHNNDRLPNHWSVHRTHPFQFGSTHTTYTYPTQDNPTQHGNLSNEWTTSAQRPDRGSVHRDTQLSSTMRPNPTCAPLNVGMVVQAVFRHVQDKVDPEIPWPNYGKFGGRPPLVARGAEEADGSSEAGTTFRTPVRFGGGCDMISGRGQFNNGGGPPPSTSELRKCWEWVARGGMESGGCSTVFPKAAWTCEG